MPFSPSDLWVITPYSNPMVTQVRPRLHREFQSHMMDSGVNLITVEACLGDRSHDMGYAHERHIHVPVRHTTIVWHKESLLNVGLQHLPPGAKHVAFIDGDIRFRDRDWAVKTVCKLQQFPVVQPWQHAYDLGPQQDHLELHQSFASLVQNAKFTSPKWSKDYTYGHPGYAWAFTVQAIEWIGTLLDFAPLGSADIHMAYAFLGRMQETFGAELSDDYKAHLLAWQDRAVKHIQGRVGYVPGTIEHSWHGAKPRRNYVTRPQILKRHNFNPLSDLKYNRFGVIELSGNKPELAMDIDRYFRQRIEDANVNL